MINKFFDRSLNNYTQFTTFLYAIFLLCIFTGTPVTAQLPVIGQDGKYESPFARVYEKVAPSVVRIDIKLEQVKTDNTQRRSPWDFFFESPQQRGFKRPDPMGSGVIVDREGHILTNNHVIANADKISVKVSEKETYEAEVVGTDPESDIAVIKLKLDGELLPEEYVAELGDSDSLKPGDYAIAIGNPIGLERTINVGVVSALGRHDFVVAGAASPIFQDFIQTDAQINPGNSGGALADINGKVIGINDMYTARYAGIGFAIPVNLARNIMTQLITSGTVKRGLVGIKVDENKGVITPEIQEAMSLSSRDGVLINEVQLDTPAEKAGLERGDVIVSLNGEKIKGFQDFRLRIADHSPGDKVELGIIHNKKEKTVELTLSERPPMNTVAKKEGDNWRGIHVVDIDDPATQKYGLGTIDSGVVIVKIDEGSPASEENLRPGDVIVEIENEEIKNTEDFRSIKNKISNSSESDIRDKTILIFKERISSNGKVTKGFVAVKSK